MTLLKVLSKRLSTELMSQVRDALGDDFDFDYVPRKRLNDVIGQRNELRKQLEALDSGDDLDDEDLDDNDDDSAVKTKKKQGKKDTVDAAAELKKLKDQHDLEMLNLKKRYALTEELRNAGCKDPELLIGKFDFDTLKFDAAGKLDGYKESIDGWKKSHTWMFDDGVPAGTGASGNGGSGAGAGDDVTVVDKQLANIFGFEN